MDQDLQKREEYKMESNIISNNWKELIKPNKLNIQTRETHINFNQIHLMDESFITSTGIGLLPCCWEGWKSKYVITNQIKRILVLLNLQTSVQKLSNILIIMKHQFVI